MPRIHASQVTFVAGGAIVAGLLEGDATKVIVARLGEPGEALELAIAVAAGMGPDLDVDDDDVEDVLEKPGDGLIGG